MKINFNDIEIDTDSFTKEIKDQLRTALAETDDGNSWIPYKGEEYWVISDVGIDSYTWSIAFEQGDSTDRSLLEIGNIFKTEEAAEKHVTYLKALKVLREDTKGYEYRLGDMYYTGYYDSDRESLGCDCYTATVVEGVKFATETHINASFAVHKKEWLIVLGVE
jgi:hypothetical protein